MRALLGLASIVLLAAPVGIAGVGIVALGLALSYFNQGGPR